MINGRGDLTVLKVIFLFMFGLEMELGARKEEPFLHIGIVHFIYLLANVLISICVVIDSNRFL